MRNKGALVAVLVLAGCAGQGGGMQAGPAPAGGRQAAADQVVTGQNGVRGDIIGTPAPGSKFSRVRIGMPMKQVEDLIGPPSDTAGHITGKAFIPFYFGGDTHMLEAFYRGEGQLSYAPANFGTSAYQLVRIIVDPSEQGYAH
jgi:hypothetical protein